jgi:hypothetical protein
LRMTHVFEFFEIVLDAVEMIHSFGFYLVSGVAYDKAANGD